MKPCLLAAYLLSVATVCVGQAAQPTAEVKWGTVEGVVLDSQGNPLPDATVTSYSQAKGVTRDVMQYQTNAHGEFSLRFPEGKVWLSAHKNSEEYPYAFFAFYLMPKQVFPTVEVKAGATAKGVVVRVGAKAAHLNYEAVNEDGRLVAGSFIFTRLDQAQSYNTGAPAKDDLLVPPMPFRAEFEAKGYKPWHYGGDKWSEKEGIISLKSGEVLNLTIHLQRESKTP
jgi:hypothetical protein